MDQDTIYRRRWGTLVVLCFSLLVIGIDNTILNVALPTLGRDLHASTSGLQWIVDAYTLVFAGLLLTAGSLGDRFGRKKALTAGLLIFGVGSILSAFSGSTGMLTATRALMGVGGALIMPSTLSILTNTFLDPRERARAIGIWAGVSGVGVAIGPVVGGWLLQNFWWGSVFLVNIPVVIIAIALGRVLVAESRDPSSPELDPLGAVLSIAGLTALLWSIIEAPSHGWTSMPIVVALLLAAVILTAFVTWELRSDHPMLDVRFFKNPRFTAASSAISLVFFALFGSLFLITLYLQSVHNYTALQAGLRIAPIAVALMISAPASAALVQRLGSKVVVATGLILAASGLALFATLQVHTGYPRVLLAILILGVGMGLTMAPATDSIMGSLPRAKAGVGSAVNDTTRQVGGALGVAILGSILSSTYASRMTTALSGHAVPAAAASAAKNSIGGALAVATAVGGDAGRALAGAARNAFVAGMHPAVLAAAAVALVGALIVIVFLPARAARVPADIPESGAELEPATA
jgi:EmrB/QacA subfamily drug resistance transporter